MKSEHPQFSLGQLYGTPGARDAVDFLEMMAMLRRHVRGDWGVVSEDDAAENELSLANGYRIVSAYIARSGHKIWVITEADRSSTTVLLPSEY